MMGLERLQVGVPSLAQFKMMVHSRLLKKFHLQNHDDGKSIVMVKIW